MENKHTGLPNCPECARVSKLDNVDELVDALLIEWESVIKSLGNFVTNKIHEKGRQQIARLKIKS